MKLRYFASLLILLSLSLTAWAQKTQTPQPVVVTNARNIVRFELALVAGGQPHSVPSGKLLVITNISIRGNTTGVPPIPIIIVQGSNGTDVFQFWVDLVKHSYTDQYGGYYTASLSAPLYVDGGGSVRLDLYGTVPNDLNGGADFQGYLMDCGSGCTQQ